MSEKRLIDQDLNLGEKSLQLIYKEMPLSYYTEFPSYSCKTTEGRIPIYTEWLRRNISVNNETISCDSKN